MKKLILISALLFSFNGWAEQFTYDGNDYDECMSKAYDASYPNVNTYLEYIKVCKGKENRMSKEEKQSSGWYKDLEGEKGLKCKSAYRHTYYLINIDQDYIRDVVYEDLDEGTIHPNIQNKRIKSSD